MRWPWVSREAYETLERERNFLTGQLAGIKSALADQLTRHHALVDRVLEMKREGFATAPTAPAPEAEARLPAEVTQALDTIGLQGAMRAQMERWAWQQLDRDRDPAVIASELIQGGLREVDA